MNLGSDGSMNLLQFIDRQLDRLGHIGARGWLVVGLYALTWRSLTLIHNNAAFAKLEEIVIQGLVIQGFLGLAAAFYFAASKGGTELADRNQTLVEKQAEASPPINKDAEQ